MAKTIKAIAEEIGVSKQAVFKKIKHEPLSTALQGFMSMVDGRLMVEVDGEKLIKQAFCAVDGAVDGLVDGASTEKGTVDGAVDGLVDGTSTEKGTVDGAVDGLVDGASTEKGVVDSTVDGVISVLQAAVDTLQGQLAVKDKQIEELNKRLSECNAALQIAQQTAQAAQALHAGTIQQRLADEVADREADQLQVDAVPCKKKSWFSRLFGKKE